MTYTKMRSWLEQELQGFRDTGLFKEEKIISTPQGPHVDTQDGEGEPWTESSMQHLKRNGGWVTGDGQPS